MIVDSVADTAICFLGSRIIHEFLFFLIMDFISMALFV